MVSTGEASNAPILNAVLPGHYGTLSTVLNFMLVTLRKEFAVTPARILDMEHASKLGDKLPNTTNHRCLLEYSWTSQRHVRIGALMRHLLEGPLRQHMSCSAVQVTNRVRETRS